MKYLVITQFCLKFVEVLKVSFYKKKFYSRKLLNKYFNMWYVSRFENIGLITKYKTICRRVLILVDLLKTTFFQKCFLHFVIRLIDPNRKICPI